MDQYEDRALVLIRQALDSSPAGERPSLWHDKVELDRAFDRLRTLPRYRALVREFGQGINTAVR